MSRTAFALLLGCAMMCTTAPAAAQRDTVLVAGEHYSRGPLFRLLFGADYRALWTTPVRAELLDLGSYAGGLTPTTAGGGFQTKSLRFRGADGYEYGFRSVDKDPGVLPPELDSTFIQDLVRDQTVSQHPGAPPVIVPLLAAAGILHTDPILVVLPDDPRLGEHRARFAGTLGYFERRAVVRSGTPPFAGASELINTVALRSRLRAGPDERIAAERYLAARLIDILVGDWDRHQDQWRWVRFGDSVPTTWHPVPEDRDQAFVRFDGFMLGVARVTAAPQFTNFGPRFASTAGQTWNGRDIDREFLTPLAPETWDSVAADLAARLTDSVIDAAARRLPPAWYELDGPRLARALRSRRDGLREEARRWFRQLNREADLHGTDAGEEVRVRRGAAGLDVAIARRGEAPYLTRHFRAGVTREVRLHLHGGADRVEISGDGPASIRLRVIAGGDVDLLDSSRAGNVSLYVPPGSPELRPLSRAVVDRRAWDPPRRQETDPPPRDWGRRTTPATWVTFGPDVGLFAGSGFTTTRYRFRHLPWASQWQLRGGYSTGGRTFRVALDGAAYRENSAAHYTLSLLASGIEVLHYHGLGNDSRRTGPNPYYRVEQKLLSLEPAFALPAGRRGRLSAGARLAFSHAESEPGRILADSQPYGAGEFGYAGLHARAEFDARDLPANPTSGWRLRLAAAAYPAVLDAAHPWADLMGETTRYLSDTGIALRPVLALRLGARSILGTFPFHAAAFVGDAATARLGWKNRYAGDLALWTGAELRTTLGRHRVLLPGQFGLTLLGDAARVWLDGHSPGTWHGAAGAGLWFSLARPSTVMTLSFATSSERSALYLSAGLPW
jgi:hypothetical protein